MHFILALTKIYRRITIPNQVERLVRSLFIESLKAIITHEVFVSPCFVKMEASQKSSLKSHYSS